MGREEAPRPPQMETAVEKKKTGEKQQKNFFHAIPKKIYITILTNLFFT